jgi:type IV pilus assembly protein PilC
MEFVAKVGTPDGRIREEVHEAPDAASLRTELERRGLHVFRLEQRGFALRLPRFGKKGRHRPVPPREFLVFNQELAALLRAGLPLLQSLELLLERMKDPHFKLVLGEIRDRVKSGEELSDAFASFGPLFPSLYPSALKAGERSGELEAVIRRFVRYQKLVLDARRRVVSALVYPAVLVALSIAMVMVMLVAVIPRFAVFFEETGGELPMITQITLGTAYFLRENVLLLGVGLVVGILALRRYAATPAGRIAIDRFKLRIPFVGPVLHLFALSEFGRSLSTLLSGGIPLVPALEIAVPAVGNAHVRHELLPVIPKVREGQAFYQTLERTGVMEPIAVDMVQVGEATGALDVMLSSVSDFFDEEVETRLARILSLIEPLMLVFMGVVIGLLLVSVYLPMFSAIGNVK